MANTDTFQAPASFRAPAFTSHDPALWFTILEVNFRAHSITTSLSRFSYACTSLPADVVSQVADVIAAVTTSDTPYEDLKQAVLARLESSVTSRLRELLSKEELGSEKPSDLLRRMKRLLGDKFETFDRTLFTHLFYQRLPPGLQRNLFSVKDKLSLDDLAQLADDYMASAPVEPLPSVATVTSGVDSQHMAQLIAKLTLQVNTLSERVDSLQRRRSPSPRSPSPQRHHRRSRSRSGSRHTPGTCYYHKRFGSAAIKCTKPCTFTGQELNGNGGC